MSGDGGRPHGVRFGRLQSKGVLLGLSAARLVALSAAVGVAVPALLVQRALVAGVAVPLIVVLVASAAVPIGGQSAVEWVPVAGHWALRRALGQNVYGVRPSQPRPAGTLALPGDAARLRVHVDEASGAAMIHDPHRQTLSVTAVVSHGAFVLLGPGEQDRRVSAWGRVLAALAATGQIAAIQILEATIPGTGAETARYWELHGVSSAGWPARNYQNLIRHAGPASSRHRTTLTLTLDMRAAARDIRRHGCGLPGAAEILRQDMRTLTSALRAAELRIESWLAPADLARLLREAYDPRAYLAPDLIHDLAVAGPAGVVEYWDHFVSDDAGHSAVLWVSEWPRTEVPPSFLHPLILKSGIHKTFCLLARPIGTREAIRSIRRQKVDYITDTQQKARIGQLQDFTDDQEYADLLQREREMAAGHTDLIFTGFIAVTATSKDDLDSAVAEVQRAATQCGCETRRLVGQQTQAFVAAALPFGRGL